VTEKSLYISSFFSYYYGKSSAVSFVKKMQGTKAQRHRGTEGKGTKNPSSRSHAPAWECLSDALRHQTKAQIVIRSYEDTEEPFAASLFFGEENHG
ncbi:MAG: hypothetical protein KAR36_05245, partial [Candidatus Latescibacteria bacterium]|nr:hypothetical protein [Candidatus Latescibacterota bacterium]